MVTGWYNIIMNLASFFASLPKRPNFFTVENILESDEWLAFLYFFGRRELGELLLFGRITDQQIIGKILELDDVGVELATKLKGETNG